MSEITVHNTLSLQGVAEISSSKNAILPIMAASVLTGGETELLSVPNLEDVRHMSALLEELGCKVLRQEHRLVIDSTNANATDIVSDHAQKLRASFLLVGPMLSKFGEVSINFPGGCNIGARPVDLHINAFAQMGAEVNIQSKRVSIKGKLKGCKIFLPFPSVGATENIIAAACMAEGQTIIQNAAIEPEISDFANYLRCIGARVHGDGTRTISVEGVKNMRGASYRPIPDRIEAGTFLIACAATGGDLLLYNTRCEHLGALLIKLAQAGAEIRKYPNSVRITCRRRLVGIDVTTMPYPGFPTDLLPQLMAFSSISQGVSALTETVFESRFKHVEQLCALGADITVQGRTALISGKRYLTGTDVYATDLRAGAAMIIAGLCAQGETVIHNCEHIDRGYANIEQKFCALGAVVGRGREIALPETELVSDTGHVLTHA